MNGTLFGVPLELNPSEIERLVRLLSSAWIALTGRPPCDLDADLRGMISVFGTGAKPKTVKDKAYTLPVASDEERALADETLVIVDGSALITPEGRILLEVLGDLQRTARITIGAEEKMAALSRALTLRTSWQQAWFKKQFEGTLSAPPLGAALFLLLNGSVGPRTALLLPSDDVEDRRLGQIVLPKIADFSTRLGGRVPETTGGLRKHWAFSQVSRILGRDVAREAGERGTIMYVRPGREDEFLDDIVIRLTRMADAHRRYEAITTLVSGYRDIRGELAAIGQMHEDPTITRRIVNRVANPVGDLGPEHGPGGRRISGSRL